MRRAWWPPRRRWTVPADKTVPTDKTVPADKRARTTSLEPDPVLEATPAPAWAVWTSLVLGVIGLGIAIYLTYEHYTGNKSLVCSDNGAVNCAKVTTSKWSSLLGVPVAVYGLVFFVVLIPLLLPKAWAATDPRVRRARLAVVSAGMASVIYLVCIEAFKVRAICLWCTGVHVITFLLFLLVLIVTAMTAPLEMPTKQDIRRSR
jgi:uncharacterized membrane protein